MPDRVIFVVGLAGVGKTTLSTQLALRLGSVALSTGQVLRAFLLSKNVGVNRLSETGRVFLSNFSEDVVGDILLTATEDAGAKVLDGVRLFSTLTHFVASGVQVDVVRVVADEPTRLDRFCKRAISDGEARTTPEALAVVSGKDTWGKDDVLFAHAARWRFDNSGSIESLHGFADKVVTDLIASGTA